MSETASGHLTLNRVTGRDFGHVASEPLSAEVEHAPGLTRGLGDGSRSPKSVSEKKETERLGRPKQEEAVPPPTIQDEESPRARRWTPTPDTRTIADVLPDRQLRAYLREELGDSAEESDRRAAMLGPSYFERMWAKIQAAGGIHNIEAVDRALRLARALAIGIEQAPIADGAVR